ncbi:MAG: YciI family protein [Candidatus Dormibacteraeota bacterium]|nr:YciI family protein [Candidatus Dormibacteraeota bacterium]MBO0704532.1 YciI family protein [Candidatus Dormibacteraeota bacterium]MBO0762216.1 YciI family protein [Candidatus Dormibacteraeota bacterium]
MKYLLMIYQNAAEREAMAPSEMQGLMEEAGRLVAELTATGELVGGEGLADASAGRAVRVREGVATVTDGPYAESKEQIVGYCIVDCESLERAVEIATRWPDARHWGMEVRPILSPDGVEM